MQSSTSKTLLVTLASAAVASGAYVWFTNRASQNQRPKSKNDKAQTPLSSANDLDGLIQQRFEGSVKHMKTQISKLSHSLQLEFYALYKQATTGNATDFYDTPPSAYDVVAKAKYDAWAKLDKMARTQAMQLYIDKAVHIEFTQSMLRDDEDEDLEGDAVLDVEGMGIRQSTLAEPDPETKAAEAEAVMKFPLHKAARDNETAVLETLLKDGTHRPDDLDEEGQTALHLAADSGHPDCIRMLVKHGANVRAADNDGISVLQAAVIAGNVDSCRLLCKLGADPDQKDSDGDTPRDCAKDDPSLQDLFLRASMGKLSFDADFQSELQVLGKESQKVPSKKEAIKAIQNISMNLSDDDGDI